MIKCWRCGDEVLEMWLQSAGDVVTKCWRCGYKVLELWLQSVDVVKCWRLGK